MYPSKNSKSEHAELFARMKAVLPYAGFRLNTMESLLSFAEHKVWTAAQLKFVMDLIRFAETNKANAIQASQDFLDLFKRAGQTLTSPSLLIGVYKISYFMDNAQISIYANNPTWYTVANFNSKSGIGFTTHKATEADIQFTKELVTAPREQLLAQLIAYGKETITCCFCGRSLENSESRTRGYGPVCADNWGLPWGI